MEKEWQLESKSRRGGMGGRVDTSGPMKVCRCAQARLGGRRRWWCAGQSQPVRGRGGCCKKSRAGRQVRAGWMRCEGHMWLVGRQIYYCPKASPPVGAAICVGVVSHPRLSGTRGGRVNFQPGCRTQPSRNSKGCEIKRKGYQDPSWPRQEGGGSRGVPTANIQTLT